METKKIVNPRATRSYQSVRQSYEDYMLLKNYSISTIKTYLCNFRKYHEWCVSSHQAEIYDQETVRQYLLYRVKNGARWQTMNNIYSAMRKLFREVLELEWSMKKFSRPRKERILPELISRQEVKRLICSCRHLKHQAILVTLYATGLSSGELCSSVLNDIDGARQQLHIRTGKGAKDRYVHVPKELIGYLRMYYKKCRPEKYLFNGRRKGERMSVSSLRWPIRQAKKRMGITKSISPHTFRHCYLPAVL